MPAASRRPAAEVLEMLESSYHLLVARSHLLIQASRELHRQSLDLRDGALALRIRCRKLARPPA